MALAVVATTGNLATLSLSIAGTVEEGDEHMTQIYGAGARTPKSLLIGNVYMVLLAG
jgi:hypothetical protein